MAKPKQSEITQMLALLYVARRGICQQQDIEYALGLTGQTTSQVLAHWLDKELLEKIVDPTDERHKLVTLTPKGQEWYKETKQKDRAI